MHEQTNKYDLLDNLISLLLFWVRFCSILLPTATHAIEQSTAKNNDETNPTIMKTHQYLVIWSCDHFIPSTYHVHIHACSSELSTPRIRSEDNSINWESRSSLISFFALSHARSSSPALFSFPAKLTTFRMLSRTVDSAQYPSGNTTARCAVCNWWTIRWLRWEGMQIIATSAWSAVCTSNPSQNETTAVTEWVDSR